MLFERINRISGRIVINLSILLEITTILRNLRVLVLLMIKSYFIIWVRNLIFFRNVLQKLLLSRNLITFSLVLHVLVTHLGFLIFRNSELVQVVGHLSKAIEILIQIRLFIHLKCHWVIYDRFFGSSSWFSHKFIQRIQIGIRIIFCLLLLEVNSIYEVKIIFINIWDLTFNVIRFMMRRDIFALDMTSIFEWIFLFESMGVGILKILHY